MPDVARVTGHKQGGTPDSTWSRPPTFEDVAQSLLAELLGWMK
jgi:hypothetical protein